MSTDNFHVILVHGTFARGAKWTREGSALRTYLLHNLPGPVTFHEFDWSGWPSHIARHIAAMKLRSRLESIVAEAPNALHIIVAHSHGGMVALYALRDQELAAEIDSIIALSTPFLVLNNRYLNIVGKYGIGLVDRVLLATSFLGIWYFLVAHSAGSFLSYIMLSAVFLLVGGYSGYYYGQCTSWLRATLQLPNLGQTQLFVMRGPADEANALLLTMQFLQYMISSSWSRPGYVHLLVKAGIDSAKKLLDLSERSRIYRAFLRLCFVTLIVYPTLAVFHLVSPLPEWTDYLHPPVKTVFEPSAPLGPKFFFFVMAVVFLLGCIFLLLGAFFMSIVLGGTILLIFSWLVFVILMLPIAPELGLFSLSLDISVEPAPRGEYTIRQIYALGHSATYNDREALEAITMWLLRKSGKGVA